MRSEPTELQERVRVFIGQGCALVQDMMDEAARVGIDPMRRADLGIEIAHGVGQLYQSLGMMAAAISIIEDMKEGQP